MIIFIRTLAAVAAGTVMTASALAQTVSDTRGPTPLIGIRSEPPASLVVEPIEDAQQQARDLLTGSAIHQGTVAPSSPIIAVSEHSVSNVDPQEQARRLILGPPQAGTVIGTTIALALVNPPLSNRSAKSDPQELARRMILGAQSANSPIPKRSASAAPGTTSPR